jgi:hypothetical protein
MNNSWASRIAITVVAIAVVALVSLTLKPTKYVFQVNAQNIGSKNIEETFVRWSSFEYSWGHLSANGGNKDYSDLLAKIPPERVKVSWVVSSSLKRFEREVTVPEIPQTESLKPFHMYIEFNPDSESAAVKWKQD